MSEKKKINIPVLNAIVGFFKKIGRGIKTFFIRVRRFLRHIFAVKSMRSLGGDIFVMIFLILFSAMMYNEHPKHATNIRNKVMSTRLGPAGF